MILSLLCLCGVQACISDDFTTSSAVRLGFSRDTVAFDTVFTDLGTPTARLKVFNREKKSVNISSIRFADEDTPFTLNVDGVSGRDFHDVEIRGGDSIFIFIECFLPETQASKPYRVEDKLQFVTNGTTQSVVVEAYGQNVTRLRNAEVTSDMTLTADRPYVIFDSLTVRKGATLRIEPGARLLFHDKGALVVEGTLEAIGEPGRLIELRGDRLDNVLPDVGYDILSGQWRGVRIAADSYDNRMEYCDMRSTSFGLRCDSTPDQERTKLTLVNSWLHNSEGCALKADYAKVRAYGCVFSEAGEAVVSITGGDAEFSQCTVSNYYLFALGAPLLKLGHAVSPAGATPSGDERPLLRGHFDNGILYGMSASIVPGDLRDSGFFVRYTMLKEDGKDDDNFLHCLWGEDPEFETVREDYYFNYHLKEGSPAIGAGDPALVPPESEVDIDGVPRKNPPALGAYSAP